MSLPDLTVAAVKEAIEEYDRLKRPAFLKKYGFGKARSYVLKYEGRPYDSKAIAGAAHGYLPGQKPLSSAKFSGGEATVKKTLEDLGFEVVGPDPLPLPCVGDVLSNSEITTRFMVGNMGGMRRSTARDCLVLISDPFKGMYQDRWEGDVLHYTGMGQSGDQNLSYSQNRTLAESHETGIAVHLLEAFDQYKYTYLGQVELVGRPHQEEQVDDDGALRKVWMFPLRLKGAGVRPTPTDEQVRAIEENHSTRARKLSTDELKKRAQAAKKKPVKTPRTTSSYVRDAAVAELAKRLANGVCDLCDGSAPFKNKNREAYLECHHVTWLAEGGDDTIENTVALCPNCHRKMHILNLDTDKRKLLDVAKRRAAS